MLNLLINGERISFDNLEAARAESRKDISFWRETLVACCQDEDFWNDFINELWQGGGAEEATKLYAVFRNKDGRRWAQMAMLLEKPQDHDLWRALVAADQGEACPLVAWLEKVKSCNELASVTELTGDPALGPLLLQAQNGNCDALVNWLGANPHKSVRKERELIDEEITWLKERSTRPTVRTPSYQLGDVRQVRLSESLSIDMIYCPAGQFLMGSPDVEVGHDENEEQREVVIERGFWLGKTPVTQRQWLSVMGENPSSNVNLDCPVERVTWYDCMDFIAKVDQNLRLPREEEWEYACRAGREGSLGGYPSWSSAIWYKDNAEGKPHPVNHMIENQWGFLGMLGNVWEWCMNRYQLKDGNVYRWRRGGSYMSQLSGCRAAVRMANPPNFRWDDLGFRVACSAER